MRTPRAIIRGEAALTKPRRAAPALEVARGPGYLPPGWLGCSALNQERPSEDELRCEQEDAAAQGGGTPSLHSRIELRQTPKGSSRPSFFEASSERRRLGARSALPPTSQGEEPQRQVGAFELRTLAPLAVVGVPPGHSRNQPKGWCFVRGGTPKRRPRIRITRVPRIPEPRRAPPASRIQTLPAGQRRRHRAQQLLHLGRVGGADGAVDDERLEFAVVHQEGLQHILLVPGLAAFDDPLVRIVGRPEMSWTWTRTPGARRGTTSKKNQLTSLPARDSGIRRRSRYRLRPALRRARRAPAAAITSCRFQLAGSAANNSLRA